MSASGTLVARCPGTDTLSTTFRPAPNPGETMKTIASQLCTRRFMMSASQIPPMPDPDPVDPPGQDDLPGIPPEPLRDPERVPPLPVNAGRIEEGRWHV